MLYASPIHIPRVIMGYNNFAIIRKCISINKAPKPKLKPNIIFVRVCFSTIFNLFIIMLPILVTPRMKHVARRNKKVMFMTRRIIEEASISHPFSPVCIILKSINHTYSAK